MESNELLECIDSIEVNGIKYRRLKLQCLWGDNIPVYWVEGIGTNTDFWATSLPVAGRDYSYMKACYDNGKLVFEQDDFMTNPVTAIDNTAIDTTDVKSVYDLLGRPVSVPQKGHIYIYQDKKYLVR